MNSTKVKLLLLFAYTLLIGAKCDKDKEGESTQINPCSYTLCVENSTCIEIPNPHACQLEAKPANVICKMEAICILNTVPPRYCGSNGFKCDADEKCKLVQPECFTTPCPPILTCVPRASRDSEGIEEDKDIPLTRAATSSIKTKVVIDNNNVFITQRKNGRPQAGKHTSITITQHRP